MTQKICVFCVSFQCVSCLNDVNQGKKEFCVFCVFFSVFRVLMTSTKAKKNFVCFVCFSVCFVSLFCVFSVCPVSLFRVLNPCEPPPRFAHLKNSHYLCTDASINFNLTFINDKAAPYVNSVPFFHPSPKAQSLNIPVSSRTSV